MRRICWDQNLVRQLFTTEADTKLTRASFFQLHQPFDRIRIVATKPYVFAAGDVKAEEDQQFVGETGLLRAFQASKLQDPNRIFVLTGEPGSGKSHLARWLYHMLDGNEERAVIHIPRRINTLVGVLKHLADVVGLVLEQEPSSYLLEAPPGKVVRYLVSYLDMAVGPGTPAGERLPLLARVATRTELEAVLAQQVARYQAARKVGTADGAELIMVPEEDFVRLSPGGTLPERAEAYAALRHHLTEALRKLTNLDRFDLRTEMERLSRAFVDQGRRPVLILEDITSFDLLHDDLLTFLLDEAAGHFDALVCWTTGYEKAYMRTYQLDRYAARLSLSDDNMEVYSLQGGGFQKLVKGYLDAVKPWCKRGVCELYDQCVPAFEGLYPFNSEALGRIYDNLIGSDQQHRKTPRNLLDRAVKSYLEVAEGHGTFPPLQQPPVVRDILYEEELFRFRQSNPAFVALVSWYGKSGGDKFSLNPEVPRLLGISVPERYKHGETVVVPYRESVGEQSPDAQGAVAVASSATVLSHVRPERLEANQQLAASNKLKELRLEVQNWMSTLRVPPHAVELTRSVHKLFGLFKLRFPVPLGHPEGLAVGISYGKQLGESNLTLAGTKGKTTPAEQFMITPGDALALGRMDEVWQGALELHVTGRLPSHSNISFLAEWSRRRYSQYKHALVTRLEQVLGMPLEAWVLAARWTLLAAYSAQTRPGYAELLGEKPVVALPSDLAISGLNQAEVEWALRELEQVTHGVFTVAKGVYDAPLVLQTLKGLKPGEFLTTLAAVSHTKIDPDYRVGILTQLRDVARAVKQVAQALLADDVATLAEPVKKELTMITDGLRAEPAELLEQMDAVHRVIGLTGQYDLYDAVAGKGWAEGRQMLSKARLRLPEVERLAGQPVTTAWSYLEVAHAVAELRTDNGIQAAHAGARTALGLTRQLGLSAESGPVLALKAVVEVLHDQSQSAFVTVGDALTCLEAEVSRRESVPAREALDTLRQELLAGD